MDLQEIEVFIDPDGRVRIEVRGVKGGVCLELTQALEQALGGQVESREMTPEALEENVQPVQPPRKLKRG